jgi:GcrA cell cycle regulator
METGEMSGPSPWTEERLAMLRAEWATGDSTAEIGRRMGISKNAVIGKARRMELAAREAPANIAKQTRPRASSPARPSAGRDACSFPGQSRPVTISGVTSSAVERRVSSRLKTCPRRLPKRRRLASFQGRNASFRFTAMNAP